MRLEKRSSFGWPATAAGTAPCKTGMVVHFDGFNQGLAKKGHSACRAYWVATRKFHMGSSRGWLDIGYSFAVCPHGVVLEGRGWQRQQAAQPGGNTTWTSCTFMSGPDEKPTTVQVEAFRELRSYLRAKGLAAAIRPHKSFVSTDCPGPILSKLVADGTLTGAPAGPPPWPGRLLKVASPLMAGADVTWVQRRLNVWHSSPAVQVDGSYGPKTAAGVKAFQKAHKLDADGVVGGKTWTALGTKP